LVLNPSTGKAREVRLRVRPAPFGRAAWSPAGELIAFAGVTGGERGRELTDIFVAGTDGSGLRRLTQTGGASEPLWSPDGSTLVFSEHAPGERFRSPVTLWAIGVEGGGRRELTRADGLTRDVAGSFSPDGRRLLFTRVRDSTVQQLPASIHVLQLEDGAVERLLDRAAMPAYSPDGNRIAYATDLDENGSFSYGDKTSFAAELYVTDADGSDRRRLTRTRGLDELSPSWSPDGNVIAYVRGKQFDNAEGYAVMAMTADGACARFLAADPSFGTWYGSPAWRPTVAEVERCPRGRPAGILRNDFRLELRRARAFRGFPLFWTGDRVSDLFLADILTTESRGPGGRGTVYDFIYRNCRIAREGSGCAGFSVQLWPACARVPGDVDLPNDGRIRIRGVQGVFFEGGNRLEIVSGRATIVIFADGRGAALRAARALRGVNVRLGARDKLPRPASGTLRRQSRCR
jgi:Tol biopolymer transport system component